MVRSFPAQARLALGTAGVVWATAAGIVGLVSCAVSFAQVALSLRAAEVENRQQNAAEILGFDHATRQLLRTVHLMSYGQRQPAEVRDALREAWPKFSSALATVCGPLDGNGANTDRRRAVCATGSAMHEILAPEIAAFAPPGRLIAPSEFGKAIALVGDLNSLSAAVAGDANTNVGRLIENYGTSLLVLALSTAGFSGAGLILILLVGRTSVRHFEQWRQATVAAHEAGAARDLLRETIDALPAGVVLYDQQERLVMFNTAAVAASPLLRRPDVIGISYEELAHETAKLAREFDGPLLNTPEEWIERFRSKGERRMRQSIAGRWFEWSEKLTASGRTVGLRVDVTDLKTQELEIARSRDLLQETIDALPAGVVLYDRDERLVMFNKAAGSMAFAIASPEAIGKTYAELAYEAVRRNEAAGITLDESPERWIARFRSKGERHLRRAPDGRWIEWLEKGTQNGGTVGLRVDVTELKTRELELERARAEYQALIDSLSDAVYVLNAKGVFTFASSAAADLLGVPVERLVGTRFLDHVASDDIDQAAVAGRSLVRSSSEAVHQVQIRMMTANREVRHVEIRYRKPVGGVTRDAAQIGVIRDVGERVDLLRRLEGQMAELERARAEYQSLVDSMSDMVHTVDARTATVTFASAASSEVLGWSPSQLIGTSALDHIVAADVEHAVAETKAALADPLGRVRQFQYRARTAGGAERHVEVRTRRMRDPDGRSTVVGVMRDVEDRVQLTRRLDAEMARLRSIVESSGAMIVLVDRALKVVMVNSGFTAVTGLGGEDAVDRPLRQVVDWPLEPAVIDDWLAALPARGDVRPTRFAATMKDRQGQQRLISVTATPVVDERGRVNSIVFLGVDDTERREAEQALFDTERLATVGEMAATVAHEIAQPLQVIDIACASAREELADAAGQGGTPDHSFVAERIDRISAQVHRAGRIIGDLRAFVRGTSMEVPGLFDPAAAVRSAVDLTLHVARPAGAVLSVSAPSELPVLMGHVGKLEQVLVNLINNACDAGGRAIEVSAAALLRDGRSIVRIAVEDDGPGIADDVLPRLFRSFVTTKLRGKGTGLGLRICRRIVEEMGGTISAANRAEGGACFEILLPVAPTEE